MIADKLKEGEHVMFQFAVGWGLCQVITVLKYTARLTLVDEVYITINIDECDLHRIRKPTKEELAVAARVVLTTGP